ncbi:MAG: transposase domain-containing protein [Pseudomonadota bacterium]
MDRNVPRVTQVFAREGYEGLMRCFPPQVRSRAELHALALVNADVHKFDVFVRWSDGSVVRPQMIAFQDVFSGKILSWRVDLTPNKVAVMSAFGDLVEEYGIPGAVLFDNGREFANKWLTGGVPTRFRFKVREDDPLGVLPQLGIGVHWATPGHGQAKPIERAFRDLADDVARDPRFAGAYVGHHPGAKPANYGSRAVPQDQFLAVLAEGIDAHNAREGRRAAVCAGRSFDETFAASYEVAPVRKATEAQRRLWLMGQETPKLHARHGRITLHGSTYWSEWMTEFAGQKLIARFDPSNLHAGLHLYALEGGYLGFARCEEAAGFLDLDAAQALAREQARFRRAHRKLLAAERPLAARDVGAALDRLGRDPAPAAEAKVVRPTFGGRDQEALVAPPKPPRRMTDAERAEHEAAIAELDQLTPRAPAPVETARDRFRRALDLEGRLAAGEAVGEAEIRWLAGYQETAEYAGERMVHDDFERAERPQGA